MKKALTLILALMLCLSFAAPALAAEPTSGECGENVAWSYSDGTLTISGTGEIKVTWGIWVPYYLGHGRPTKMK